YRSGSSSRDGFDADFGVVLTVALMLLVVLATAHLEDLDLVVPAMRKNRCLDHGAGDERGANFQLVAFAHRQDLVQGDFLPDVSRYLFYLEFFASGNAILLATGFYDRVHGGFLRKKKFGIDRTQDSSLPLWKSQKPLTGRVVTRRPAPARRARRWPGRPGAPLAPPPARGARPGGRRAASC